MCNGDLISRRSGWHVVSLPFLLNCFLFPECQETKLLRTHFRNKCTVPLLLNPCIPGFQHQMLGVATSGFTKGTPSWFTHILLAKILHKDMLLLVAVHWHSIRKKEVPPHILTLQSTVLSICIICPHKCMILTTNSTNQLVYLWETKGGVLWANWILTHYVGSFSSGFLYTKQN